MFKKKNSKNSVERIKRVVDKGVKEKKLKVKINSKIDRDEAFYLECFNNSNHRCEECGCLLPDEFRDSEGRIIARWRYSHVIPKSIAPHLRHRIENINHLCLTHHSEWENGDKKNMRIFTENAQNFPEFLDKFNI